MKILISALLSLGLLGACTTKKAADPGKASPPKTPKIIGSRPKVGISFDARQLANEMESHYVSEIHFKKGSSELTTGAKSALAVVMKQAKRDGFLEKAKLITWSDKEMPSEKKKELTNDDVALAKKRNNVIADFIQSSDKKIDIDPISMAERSSGFRKYIPDERARIQESLDQAGIPETDEKNKALSKASRSIIIFTKDK